MLIPTLPKTTSNLLQRSLAIPDADVQKYQSAGVWDCSLIARAAGELEEIGADKKLGTRVQYLSRFRRFLKSIGVQREAILECEGAFKPAETDSFNKEAAERRVERAGDKIDPSALPEWLSIDGVQARVDELAEIAQRGEDGRRQVWQLFSGEQSPEGEAKTLAALMVQFAARPGELVPPRSDAGIAGSLGISDSGEWEFMLKRREGARAIPYLPVAYGLDTDDARALLSAVTAANSVGRRRALRALSGLLKPLGMTPRDLRALGAEYAIQRTGVSAGLAAEQLRAEVLRHEVLPSSATLSAYQRVEPAGARVAEAYESASDAVKAQVRALLQL